ncbi:MAG: energy transducer TonB, partial [Prevotella sp.]|nr:energy transducer TonB [Prevotella sp.]
YGSAKNGEETNIPADGSKPFITVEQMPSFPGGEAEMQRFLGNNVKYPVAAQAAGIQGRVVVRFIVGATGEISDVRVIRGVDPELDKEAVRVIKAMPKWKPGKQGGKAVNVYFTLPISFRLKGDGDEGDALDQAWAQENDKILLVVDGKIVDIGTLTTIEQNNKVESVSIKRGEEELKKYGDAAKGKDSIMEIKLKK